MGSDGAWGLRQRAGQDRGDQPQSRGLNTTPGVYKRDLYKSVKAKGGHTIKAVVTLLVGRLKSLNKVKMVLKNDCYGPVSAFCQKCTHLRVA